MYSPVILGKSVMISNGNISSCISERSNTLLFHALSARRRNSKTLRVPDWWCIVCKVWMCMYMCIYIQCTCMSVRAPQKFQYLACARLVYMDVFMYVCVCMGAYIYVCIYICVICKCLECVCICGGRCQNSETLRVLDFFCILSTYVCMYICMYVVYECICV